MYGVERGFLVVGLFFGFFPPLLMLFLIQKRERPFGGRSHGMRMDCQGNSGVGSEQYFIFPLCLLKSHGLGSLTDFLTSSHLYVKDTKSSNSRRKHLPKASAQMSVHDANWSSPPVRVGTLP